MTIETGLIEEKEILLTQKGEIRKRKPKQSILYFTQETEDAIIQYLITEDEVERNRIYNEKIDYAFHKLAENIIHTFKFYYTEVNTINELKHEVVCVLLEKLSKYKQGKGKAYSYFGTIAKRYLIVYNTNNYKKLKGKATLLEVDEDKNITDNLIKTYPTSPGIPSAQLLLAEALAKQRQLPQAREQLQGLLKRENINPEISYQCKAALADILLQEGAEYHRIKRSKFHLSGARTKKE